MDYLDRYCRERGVEKGAAALDGKAARAAASARCRLRGVRRRALGNAAAGPAGRHRPSGRSCGAVAAPDVAELLGIRKLCSLRCACDRENDAAAIGGHVPFPLLFSGAGAPLSDGLRRREPPAVPGAAARRRHRGRRRRAEAEQADDHAHRHAGPPEEAACRTGPRQHRRLPGSHRRAAAMDRASAGSRCACAGAVPGYRRLFCRRSCGTARPAGCICWSALAR